MYKDPKNTNTNDLDDAKELTPEEMREKSGGAARFLAGSLMQAPSGADATPSDIANGGGNAQASFPTGIANARFTQSGTTLCNWHKCTQYISGC